MAEIDSSFILGMISNVILQEEIAALSPTLNWRDLDDGGKQSLDNIFDGKNIQIDTLRGIIQRKIQLQFRLYPSNYDLIGFINVNPSFKYKNKHHNHPEAGPNGYGGVYYVTNTGQGGDLEFRKPRKVMEATPGMLHIFPWDYEHRVKPYTGDDDRISIAFNTIMRK